MKVIFLDIDGVLNTGKHRESLIKNGIKEDYAQFIFDPVAVNNLKRLVTTHNAKIVISSTWRYNKEDIYWKILMGNLIDMGLEKSIIGSTSDLRNVYNTINCRGYEIYYWINNTDNNIESFVIIDDDDNMNPLISNLAYCDSYFGFDDEVYIIANKILNNEKVFDSENPLFLKNLI